MCHKPIAIEIKKKIVVNVLITAIGLRGRGPVSVIISGGGGAGAVICVTRMSMPAASPSTIQTITQFRKVLFLNIFNNT